MPSWPLPPDAVKETLHRYLRNHRQAVLWKLNGLSEREIRWPHTPTGTNLLGLVKHLAYGEAGYFGHVFGRPAPVPTWDWNDPDEDPQADFFATADESREQILDQYRSACAHADETIAKLSLDDLGEVPWWPVERRQVTLHQVMVHMLADMTRHVGHADIIRELIDGSVGLRPGMTNMPEEGEVDWPAYVARLKTIAEGFPG